MLTTFHKRSPHYKHPKLAVAIKFTRAKEWSADPMGPKPFWKMANFLREYSQGTYYDISLTTYQKIEGEGKIS